MTLVMKIFLKRWQSVHGKVEKRFWFNKSIICFVEKKTKTSQLILTQITVIFVIILTRSFFNFQGQINVFKIREYQLCLFYKLLCSNVWIIGSIENGRKNLNNSSLKNTCTHSVCRIDFCFSNSSTSTCFEIIPIHLPGRNTLANNASELDDLKLKNWQSTASSPKMTYFSENTFLVLRFFPSRQNGSVQMIIFQPIRPDEQKFISTYRVFVFRNNTTTASPSTKWKCLMICEKFIFHFPLPLSFTPFHSPHLFLRQTFIIFFPSVFFPVTHQLHFI